jgi:hypothetical protein
MRFFAFRPVLMRQSNRGQTPNQADALFSEIELNSD